jgi:hypothetical protein
MLLRKGNLFQTFEPDKYLYVVTGNSVVRKNGSLVMGKGSALELKNRVLGIDHEFGQIVSCFNKSNLDYCFVLGSDKKYFYGLLQTKRNWKDKSDLELISKSLSCLNHHACKNKTLLIKVSFPGIGCGGLTSERSEILNMLQKLPDNVEVWEL